MLQGTHTTKMPHLKQNEISPTISRIHDKDVRSTSLLMIMMLLNIKTTPNLLESGAS